MRKYRKDNVGKHHKRTGHIKAPEINGNAELERAWHSLQLHWLDTVPGYREEIKHRVSVAARQAEAAARRIESADEQWLDRDWLGQEVEGCG